MDISGYIQYLLWDYECVIIPGFGGILATYRPAEIIAVQNLLCPPSKSLAFNEYLSNNDGLLINHICQTAPFNYAEASGQIDEWVKRTKTLLADNEEIYLPQIGRFHRDIERNLRFTPDTSVNYLASSYGLRNITAEPILRDSADQDEYRDSRDTATDMPAYEKGRRFRPQSRKWAMAAVIALFLTIGTIVNLMYQGITIKPLNLNASSVLGFIEDFDKQPEAPPEPKASLNQEAPLLNENKQMPVIDHMPAEPVVTTDTSISEAPAAATVNEPAAVETPKPAATMTGTKYYIITGAYSKPANIPNAEAAIKDKYPTAELYEDTSHGLIRVGFGAGDTYAEATQKLQEVKQDNKGCWLLVKK